MKEVWYQTFYVLHSPYPLWDVWPITVAIPFISLEKPHAR